MPTTQRLGIGTTTPRLKSELTEKPLSVYPIGTHRMKNTATLQDPSERKEDREDPMINIMPTAQIKDCCQAGLTGIFAVIIFLMTAYLLAAGAIYLEEASLGPTGRAVRRCMRECKYLNVTRNVNQ